MTSDPVTTHPGNASSTKALVAVFWFHHLVLAAGTFIFLSVNV